MSPIKQPKNTVILNLIQESDQESDCCKAGLSKNHSLKSKNYLF